MKSFKLHTSRCVACNKEVATVNMIKWSGKLYGKGCFNRHIKPLLDAKKLQGKEFYKVVSMTMIGIIATQEGKGYFQNSIIEQANKGYLSEKQIISYMESIAVSKRTELIATLVDSVDVDVNVRYVVSVTQNYLGNQSYLKTDMENIEKLENKEERRNSRKSLRRKEELQAMNSINELYNSNSIFKCVVDSVYPKGKIVEYCSESYLFQVYSEILESKLDKIYG